MESQAMPGFVFLDFPDRQSAEAAYDELKKINFGLFYKQVSVEFAKPNLNRQQRNTTYVSPLTVEEHEKAADPISESQGILYPPNPHLKYYYPDPTPDILTNMMYAIGSVPRLYTQVLHLMNKLNMPPPFGPAEKESKPNILKRKHDELLSSDESELEDESVQETPKEMTVKMQEEKIKQARLTRLAAEKQKLAIKSTSSGHQQQQKQQKIKILVGPRLTEDQKAIRDKCKPMSELKDLSAFKNYEQGAPSSKLYVKNLNKKITQEDLTQLFSIFSKDITVDLKTKGRLRGQAFITFPDQATSTLALECTNGYLFVDRPIAVLYGRESKQQQEEQEQ
ncbi:MAG: hypothetical protein EXX96DRAFT_564108 [Benjaminiella poitrasii]|nr:MAG: hypothetical protein EXX96DRAFT_564108 [Benjaminiella poitrasii]